jgi:hypothetical protein
MTPQATDAWILLSIGDARSVRGWASLNGVIEMADSNNHAVPDRHCATMRRPSRSFA